MIRLQLKHDVGSDTDVLTRTYWQYTGSAPTNTGLTTMCTTLATNWGTVWKPLTATGVQLLEILAVDLSSSTAALGSFTGTTTGTRAGGTLPAQSCGLINLTIGRRYRGGKPRNYLPIGSFTDVSTAQTWTGGFITSVNTALGTWAADVIAAAPGGTTITGQVNVSYYHGFASVQDPVTLRWRNIPTPRGTALVDPVTGSSLNSRFGSQRKRLIR